MCKPRKRLKVNPMPADNQVYADVFAVYRRLSHYAFIKDLEVEYCKRRAVRYHLSLECFTTEWFDGLNTENFPPVGEIAQVANMFSTELIVTPVFLEVIGARLLDQHHIYERNWVEVNFVSADMPQPEPSIIVDTYYPAAGSTNPATIGTTPNEGWAYFTDIRRVVPPSKRTDLMNFYQER